MHLAPLIRDLAVITAVAGLVTLIFQRIRQPVVLGYIVAGIIVGPYAPPFPLVTDVPNIKTFAELGVIFLMFTLGLEFSFRKLLRVGPTVGTTALFEVSFMMGLGFLTGKLLGWSTVDSLFAGTIVSISSTTIIIKAMSELGLKTRRFAQLVFGILIVEDLLAVLILVVLSTLLATGSVSGLVLATAAGKLALVVGAWFLTGYFLVPRFVRYVGRLQSNETLTLLSVGLCLALVVVADTFGYSPALGAFIMGSIVAESTESHRIEDLMAPVRDLFVAIFFVSVGMLIDPAAVWENKGVIALLVCVVIAGKSLATTFGALLTGETLRRSILVGFSLGQIGEFSFIIATMGYSLGAMSEFLYPVAVAVSLLTAFTTPYFIRHSPKLADALEKHLPPRVLTLLEAYAAWRARRSAKMTGGPEFNRRAFRWLVSGFVITLIVVTVSEYWPKTALPYAIGWAISALISAPFVWTMFTAFRGYRLQSDEPQEPEGQEDRRRDDISPLAAILANLLALAWLGGLSMAFFPARYVGIVCAIFAAFLGMKLYRQLETSYRWFEDSLLSVFRDGTKTRRRVDLHRQLAPWDGHLVRLKIHPDSVISGRRLQEAALRSRFGLSVVAIQRGSRSIVAPKPDQMLFPKDELLVLGTDEQIESVRASIESPPSFSDRAEDIGAYELRAVFIAPTSPLVGKTIRDSGIRDQFSAMVVGIERRGWRIMNPDSDATIEAEDTLWLVGETPELDRLASLQLA